MTVVTAPPGPVDGRRQRWAGLAAVLWLDVRRERLALAIWTAALAGTVVSSVAAIAGLYPTAADRVHLAGSISANPSFLALTGPITATSVGGVTAWRVGVLGGAAVALMSALTVVRRTRADEEAGRGELLASGVLGRDTALTAALTLAWGAALLIGTVSALGAIGNGLSVGGSLALGAALAGPGLVFGAVAAVSAQVFENARTASAAAGAVLAVAFALRAVGDLAAGVGWLSWLSPLGWCEKIQPFGATRWTVLWLFPAAAAALTAVAGALSRRRDLGRGLFQTRPGPAHNARLVSALSLALRLHRAGWTGWATGFLVLGALTGSLAASAGGLLNDNPRIQQLMVDLGGSGTVADELFAAMGGISALAAGAFAVSAALRVRTEESAGRADTVLATGVSRDRWLGGHLMVGLLGPALLLVIAGIAAGVVYGLNIGDPGHGLGLGLASMAVQIPAVLVIGGVTCAVIGWAPRYASLSWAVLGVSILLGQLGPLLQLPRAVMDLSPFTHVPALPVAPMHWPAVVALLLVAAATGAAGVLGFRRRDIG